MRQVDFPFKAVIFDMDGVIVDSEKFYFDELRGLFEFHHIAVSHEELCAAVGTSYQEFKLNLVRWFARGGMDLTIEQAEVLYDQFAAKNPVDYRELYNPGVAETIEELKSRGVRVALASSSPLHNIRNVLDVCCLSDAFEVVTSGEQFRESKPNPEIYLHTLEELGLPAKVCCCIEDSVPGITAGKAAGLTVFAKREERFGFSQERADAIIDTIPDLIKAAERF